MDGTLAELVPTDIELSQDSSDFGGTVTVLIAGGWKAIARFEPQNGRPVVVSLCIEPEYPEWGAPEGGIKSRLLRNVRVDEIYQQVAVQISEIVASGPVGQLRAAIAGFSFDRPPPPPRRSGRRGTEDYFYAEIAAAYSDLLRRGSRRPIVDLAAVRPHYTRGFIRDAIHEARRRGLLTSTLQGKAGGGLTELGRRVLATDPSAG